MQLSCFKHHYTRTGIDKARYLGLLLNDMWCPLVEGEARDYFNT